MKHFTISAKGIRTHTFKESGFMYILETMNDEGRIEEYFIYADNRKAACEKGKIIVSAHDINAEVKRQNGLQQIHRAELLRNTGEYTEQHINEFVERLKAYYGLNDEKEQTEITTIHKNEDGNTEKLIISKDKGKTWVEANIDIKQLDPEKSELKVGDLIKRDGITYEIKLTTNVPDELRNNPIFIPYIKYENALYASAIVDEIPNSKEEQPTAEEQPEQPTDNNTYTAYNRTFSTYEEAIQYCNESDFDPTFIEVVAHPTAYRNGSLKMDLQLFGTPAETEMKPFKKPYATYNDGVSKFGIGKHLELVYTLETTMADPEQDTRYYSNIHKYEFNNLQSALERFNLYQQLGYHNLQLWTEIRCKGKTVIENGTSGQIEFMVNNSRLKQATETEKENEQLKQQIKQYDAFIKHYNASTTLNKFLEEYNK